MVPECKQSGHHTCLSLFFCSQKCKSASLVVTGWQLYLDMSGLSSIIPYRKLDPFQNIIVCKVWSLLPNICYWHRMLEDMITTHIVKWVFKETMHDSQVMIYISHQQWQRQPTNSIVLWPNNN